MQVFGYVRVSTKNQNENRQLDELENSGIKIDKIFIDKQSGKNFDRPNYKKMISKLKPKDILVIKSIDRLGRNYKEIIEQWRIITKDMQVFINVLDMPLLNTTLDRDLIQELISDLVLQLLSFVAENERENIRQRQAEGIRAAKKRGIKFGRPKMHEPANFNRVVYLWRNKKITLHNACRNVGMSQSTFYRRVRQENNKKNIS